MHSLIRIQHSDDTTCKGVMRVRSQGPVSMRLVNVLLSSREKPVLSVIKETAEYAPSWLLSYGQFLMEVANRLELVNLETPA